MAAHPAKKVTPMKLIQISDIHLTRPGERMGGLDPHDRFAKALRDVANHHSDAARVIITGDLTHWGEAEAYTALRDALQSQTFTARLLIGNHDDRDTFSAAFPDVPRDANGYINHAEDLGGERLIYLDTVAPRTHAGHFGPDRLEWLTTTLAGCTRARLFLHHNPFHIGLPAEDRIALVTEDQAPLHAVLRANRDKIVFIHFGHVHAPISGSFEGIPFASIPSTGNQSYPDLSEPRWLLGAPLPPAYYVILVQPTGTIIHSIPFTWDGPISTFGTEWEDWEKPGSTTEAAE